MSLYLFLIKKYLFSGKKFFDFHAVITIMGVAIGVAVLIVVMSTFSGFKKSLERTLIEVVGDVTIQKRGRPLSNLEAIEQKLEPYKSEIAYKVPYLSQDGLIASKGQIRMVIAHGVGESDLVSKIHLDKRLVKGSLVAKATDKGFPAHLGKTLAKELNLKIGKSFKLVIPEPESGSSQSISPKYKKFYVASLLDLGKYDYNKRFLFVGLSHLQQVVGAKVFSGLRLGLKDSYQAEELSQRLQEDLTWSFAVRDWKRVNKNFLSAIDYEKQVIFFIIMILVVAACFNVSNTLFVSVYKRYQTISLLKTLGAKKSDILLLFSLQGMAIGLIGLMLGLFMGTLFCLGFEALQKVYPILPANVYKLSYISTDMRWDDWLMIVGATTVVCFLSTLLPALRGAALTPIEGLKYE